MADVGWVGRDLRYAVRSLRRDRSTVALALLALSLGIGATTVIFSVVYSVLVDAMPFADQSRVVHFYITTAEGPGRSAWYPANEFADYRAGNHVFSQLLGGASMEVLYTFENATYRVRGALIDPRALPTLGISPALGREVTEADGEAEAPPTFLMSDRMWAERFNRDPHILGMSLTLNGTPRTLIAILPPRFLLHNADVFFPTSISATSSAALIGGPPSQPLMVWTYGRLAPGVTRAQAEAELNVLAHNQARLHPARYPKTSFGITVMSLAEAYTDDRIKEMVYILAGAVLMLLLIACSNVANLLLARATTREGELAVRSGLGASRLGLMRPVLAESFVLALTGTGVGCLFAYLGLQWVRSAIPTDALPSEVTIRFSGQALLGTVGVMLVTTLLCGLVPALRAGRGDLHGRLLSTGKGVGFRSRHSGVRMALVAVQMTLALVLVVGAGLMARSLFVLQHIDTGIDPSNVLIGQFTFPQTSQLRGPAGQAFAKEVTRRVAALPGVLAVSPSAGFPLSAGPTWPIAIVGTTPNPSWNATLEFVGDGYFPALRLPLLRGRLFTSADIEGARNIAIVNRAFAHEFLADADPLNRTVALEQLDGMTGAHPTFDIVGVVGDTRNGGLENPPGPAVFLPFTAPGAVPLTIVVRTSGDPRAIIAAVRQQMWTVDRGAALMNTMPLETMLDIDTLAGPKFGAGLLGTFAVVGLVLASIGIFSVMSYTVSLQTHDIGIRMALGAEPGNVRRMVLRKGLRPILLGVAIGLSASYGLSRLLANQVYGVTTTDPWTFAGTAVVLTAVGTVACLIPARRATKVDPLVALRYE